MYSTNSERRHGSLDLRSPGFERLVDAIENSELVVVGGPTLLGAGMVLTARIGQDARTWAFLWFGRVRHMAGLNFGDGMSYAVASVAGLPVLFRGTDFTKTDITPGLGCLPAKIGWPPLTHISVNTQYVCMNITLSIDDEVINKAMRRAEGDGE